MTAKAVILASVLLAGASAAHATPWAADVPMTSCDGFPCIAAQFGTAPAGMAAIDTGDVASVLDTSQAAAIGFDTKPADGQIHAAYPTVTVAGVTLVHAPSIAIDLQQEIAKGAMPHADATLAYTAFKDRIIQLDFVHHRFRISDPQPASEPCAAQCASLHLITFGKRGPSIVVADGFSVNGEAITAQMDSLWSGSLLIYTASIDKLGLKDATAVTARERFSFTDGGVTELKGTAKEIGFSGDALAKAAPLYFPTPGVHEPDALFDATVGIALMKDKIVTLDFHAMTISIAKA
jgi:hypothetical protein